MFTHHFLRSRYLSSSSRLIYTIIPATTLKVGGFSNRDSWYETIMLSNGLNLTCTQYPLTEYAKLTNFLQRRRNFRQQVRILGLITYKTNAIIMAPLSQETGMIKLKFKGRINDL